MSDYIFLIVGKSGVGKTTVVEEYCRKHGTTAIESYTTRPPRFEGEQGHIFVDDEHFPKEEEWVAYTEIEGYKYCATKAQVDANDFYVIDPAGVEYFEKAYNGKKKSVIIGVYTPERVRKQRMKNRGDSEEKIASRLREDEKTFENLQAHIWIENLNLDTAIKGLESSVIEVDYWIKEAHKDISEIYHKHSYPKTVFISGKVSNCPNYKSNFEYVAESLRELDIIALHPGLLPETGFTYQQYTDMTGSMLRSCDAVMFLHNMSDSRGAQLELIQAITLHKPICFMNTFDDVYTRSALFI